MNKLSIKKLLLEKHTFFIQYIMDLKDERLTLSQSQKWSAGEQLKHIVLCLKPLVKTFGADKLVLQEKFGFSNRKSLSYEEMLNNYQTQLKAGGKAPDRFVPEIFLLGQKTILCDELTTLINDLCLKIENFSEEELDALCLPHPLLGNITLREMLYNTIQHVEHHHNQTKLNLSK